MLMGQYVRMRKRKAMQRTTTMAEEWPFHASYNGRANIEFSGLYGSFRVHLFHLLLGCLNGWILFPRYYTDF